MQKVKRTERLLLSMYGMVIESRAWCTQSKCDSLWNGNDEIVTTGY